MRCRLCCTALAFVLALFLFGCATPTAPETPADRWRLLCTAYVEALGKLTTQNRLGLLTEATQLRVDEAVSVIGPVCEREVPLTSLSVLDAAEAALVELLAARGDVQ